MSGEGGADTLDGGAAGADSISGGDGADRITAGDPSERPTTYDRDFIDGGGGDDFVLMAGGVAYGGAGDDALGGAGDRSESLFGGDGRDQITGWATAGNGPAGDLLSGEGGEDYISGGAGADSISGGADIDNLSSGAGDDTVSGGDGADIIYLGDSSTPLGNVVGYGDAGDDHIEIRAATSRVDGGDGDDLLYDEHGADTLDGGAGADSLISGAGRDVLTGGAGADYFRPGLLDARALSSFDVITDLETGVDRIDVGGLGGRYVESTAPDFDAAEAFALAQMAAGASVVVVQIGQDVAAFIDNGAGGSAYESGVVLTNHSLSDVTAADFLFR
jgi:Ca2+-binding RTX toxin-like protein